MDLGQADRNEILVLFWSVTKVVTRLRSKMLQRSLSHLLPSSPDGPALFGCHRILKKKFHKFQYFYKFNN